MCGEKDSTATRDDFIQGSPPHVRGKGEQVQAIWDVIRITPACAGKSFGSYIKSSYFKDHPRMCGEKTKKIP